MAPSTPSFLLTFLGLAALGAAQCSLEIPPNPLTAEGLATPYKLSGCDQRQFSDQGCFVEAAILDPATGNLTIYHPLVINNGDVVGVDYIAPVPITLPANAVVATWFGSNANTLTLTGTTQGCVQGFTQVAYCNAPAMFTAANKAIAAGQLTIPAPGMATKATGQACIAGTRDFRIVDMDQSDNVVTTYLLINGHKLAQNTPANSAANQNAEELSNGSDNALLSDFVQPIMGCQPVTMPSLTAPTGLTSALLLNELQSAVHPPATPAFVPENDDMVVNNGQPDLQKINSYRAGVGQPMAATLADANGTTYCKNYAASGIFIQQNVGLFSGGTSPAAATANNLYTFLANRFAASFGPVPALGCQTIFGLQDSPVAQAMDGNGVVTSASINTQILSSILNGQNVAGASTAKANSASTSAATAATAKTTNAAGGAATSTTSAAATAKTATSAAGGAATSSSAAGTGAATNTKTAATTFKTATSAAGKGAVVDTSSTVSVVSTASAQTTSSTVAVVPTASAQTTSSATAVVAAAGSGTCTAVTSVMTVYVTGPAPVTSSAAVTAVAAAASAQTTSSAEWNGGFGGNFGQGQWSWRRKAFTA